MTTLTGVYHNFGTACQEFVANNYNPLEDEVLISNENITIYKSGVVRGWDSAYADIIAHAEFAFTAMQNTKYAGTTFGGYRMTEELLKSIKEKYPTHVEATYVKLFDYDKYHYSFITFCKEHNINVLGWCYGQYQIENCPDLNTIPFALNNDTFYVEFEDETGYTWGDVVKATFFSDIKWYINIEKDDAIKCTVSLNKNNHIIEEIVF